MKGGWQGVWSPVVFLDLCTECGSRRCQRLGGEIAADDFFFFRHCLVAFFAELWSCHTRQVREKMRTLSNLSSVELPKIFELAHEKKSWVGFLMSYHFKKEKIIVKKLDAGPL